MQSLVPHSRARIFQLISEERDRQNRKWGDQSANSAELYCTILGEEFGEVCQAALELRFNTNPSVSQQRRDEYANELVQLAAVATAMLEKHIAEEERAETEEALSPSAEKIGNVWRFLEAHETFQEGGEIDANGSTDPDDAHGGWFTTPDRGKPVSEWLAAAPGCTARRRISAVARADLPPDLPADPPRAAAPVEEDCPF